MIEKFTFDLDETGCWQGSLGPVTVGSILDETALHQWGSCRSLNQVHGAQIYGDGSYQNHQQQGDGLVTDRGNTVLIVRTADCVPVLLTDGKRIGAIHAGWRGTRAGIIKEVLSHFDPTKVAAIIGPAIEGKNYEVDSDLYQDWLEQEPGLGKFLETIGDGSSSKRLFHLKGWIQEQLERAGTRRVFTIPVDTFTSALPSYRRDQSKNRIYSYIFTR